MPAQKQVTKEAMIDAATELLRRQGMKAVNARAVAARLKCSTRPIYLTFKNMDEIKAAAVERITADYRRCLAREAQSGAYPPYKAFGMGYVKYARDEKESFKYLFMRDRSKEEKGIDGGDVGEVLAALAAATGMTLAEAEKFHLEMWIFVHGIATAVATNYIDYDEEIVSGWITDAFMGLKARYAALKA